MTMKKLMLVALAGLSGTVTAMATQITPPLSINNGWNDIGGGHTDMSLSVLNSTELGNHILASIDLGNISYINFKLNGATTSKPTLTLANSLGVSHSPDDWRTALGGNSALTALGLDGVAQQWDGDYNLPPNYSFKLTASVVPAMYRVQGSDVYQADLSFNTLAWQFDFTPSDSTFGTFDSHFAFIGGTQVNNVDQFGSPLPALDPTLARLIYNNYVITAIDNMDVYVPGVKLTLSSFILADKSLDGPFDGPLNPPVPEPGTLLLLGGSLLGLCIGGFRRFRK